MIKKMSLCLALCLVFLSFISAKAYATDSKITALLENDGTDLYISLKSSGKNNYKLSVCRFYVKYDSQTAKLSKVSGFDGLRTEFCDKNGKVSIVCFNPSGFEITNQSKRIVKLNFTDTSYGKFTLSGDEAVNVDAQKLDIKYSGTVTIGKNGLNGEFSDSTDNLSEGRIGSNAKMPTVDAGFDDSEELSGSSDGIMDIKENNGKNENGKYFFMGIGVTVLLFALMFTSYKFGISKVKSEIKQEENKNNSSASSDENTDDN